MKAVWKYQLKPNMQTIEMPKGARIVEAKVQHEEPHIWAIVDVAAPMVERLIFVIGTGAEFEDGEYIASFQIKGGTYVFHAFDGGEV